MRTPLSSVTAVGVGSYHSGRKALLPVRWMRIYSSDDKSEYRTFRPIAAEKIDDVGKDDIDVQIDGGDAGHDMADHGRSGDKYLDQSNSLELLMEMVNIFLKARLDVLTSADTFDFVDDQVWKAKYGGILSWGYNKLGIGLGKGGVARQAKGRTKSRERANENPRAPAM